MLSRRRFLKYTGGVLAGSMLSGGCSLLQQRSIQAKVLVVGGGFAGATVAKTIKQLAPGIHVSLIEPKSVYITCPASNWLLADMLDISALTVNYRQLAQAYDIELVPDAVSRIDYGKRQVVLSAGGRLSYDRLIIAPGIDLKFDGLPGYNSQLVAQFPHAWQAGTQTLILQRQLQAMPDGGLVVITAPPEPYRCPPGPYERASLLAFWLQKHKPRAKLIILDAKTSFSKQKLFEAAWSKLFGYGSDSSLIEWHSLADNPLTGLDANTATLQTYFGDKFSAQVLNIIPPQQAGMLARVAELTDATGWCPVKPVSAESTLQNLVHVIGDAASFAPMPKSAFSANSQAKACAQAVVCLLQEQALPEAHWLNTCYSLVTPDYGISVAGVYRLEAEKIVAVKGAGGFSVATAEAPQREAGYAKSVYRQLVADSFGLSA